jgi:hypothetical protein
MRKIVFALALMIAVASCSPEANDYEQVFSDNVLYSKMTGQLTDVITYDIFTPPVASRIYAYSHLAAYETMVAGDSSYISMQGQLRDFQGVPQPDTSKTKINFPYASMIAFMEVGRTLTFSKDQTDRIVDSLKTLAKEHGMPKDVQEHSEKFGISVANAVLDWSKKDNYAQTRSAAKYTVPNEDGYWVPTPPAYIPAVEPQWRTIRPIALDSPNQFLPPPPVPYSHQEGTEFYKWVKDVCDIGNNLTEEQKAIASFWDCNGFKMHVVGHTMFATKAMTPGGHWMGIVGIVCKDQNADINKTIYAYTAVAFALMDAFISCWDAKYTWNLVRPETVINKYLDPEWRPFLQTPPFPEYTSGHSEISMASATVLTHIFGDNIAFRDSTERPWGWPDRNFTSFREAAEEAGMSRFYGGIHYLPSVRAGFEQGVRVGNHIISKLKMRRETASQQLAGN